MGPSTKNIKFKNSFKSIISIFGLLFVALWLECQFRGVIQYRKRPAIGDCKAGFDLVN